MAAGGGVADVSHAPPPRASAQQHHVGRSLERAQLASCLTHVADTGGLLVAVCGEPGIGKTTLVDDFVRELDDSERAHVGVGRTSERVAGTEAYVPLLDAIEDLIRRDRSRLLGRILKETAPLWLAQLGTAIAREFVARRGKPDTVPRTQDRFKRELVAFLHAASRLKPIALVIDDLHWADPSTIDLLAYLVRQLGHAPVMVVAAYRPEEVLAERHPFPAIKHDLQARGLCRSISVGFLTRADLGDYIDRVLHPHRLPAEFADVVFGKTEGNPLFMVALLHDLRETAVLGLTDGHWSLTRSVSDIARELPESVRGMIQRKIDSLPEKSHRLLLAASVQGQEFDAATVAAVLAAADLETEEQLDWLDRVCGFVHKTGDVELPDGTLTARYRFVHVLYQERLYDTLAPSRRIVLSRDTAQALERFHASRPAAVAPQLASLYEAGRDFSRAADNFLASARQAADVFAYADAVVFGQRGLDALGRLPDSNERRARELAILMVIGAPMKAVRGFASDHVLQNFERAYALCRSMPDAKELADVLWALWASQIVRLDVDAAGRSVERLEELAHNSSDSTVSAQAIAGRMLVAYYRGDFERTQEYCARMLAVYDPAIHQSLRSTVGWDAGMSAQVYLAWSSLALGFADRAVTQAEAGLAHARRLGHIQTLVYALYFAAIVSHWRADWETFAHRVEEIARLASDYQLVHFATLATCLSGDYLFQQGRHDEGLRLMREGLAAYDALRARSSRPRFAAMLGSALAVAGQPEEGLAVIDGEIRAIGAARFFESELYRVRGELLKVRGTGRDFDAAEQSFEHALALARAQRAKTFELRALTSLCALSALRGQVRHDDELLILVRGFPEGHANPAFREARALLTSL